MDDPYASMTAGGGSASDPYASMSVGAQPAAKPKRGLSQGLSEAWQNIQDVGSQAADDFRSAYMTPSPNHEKPGLLPGPPSPAVRAVDRLANVPGAMVDAATTGFMHGAFGTDPNDTRFGLMTASLLAPGIKGEPIAAGAERPRPIIASRPKPTPKPATPAGMLASEGVSLTPGQRLGGMALATEDKAMSVPILGDAIRGARVRGNRSFNRAAANRALEPIGETVPPEIAPGNDTVAHVQSRLSDAYTHANGLIDKVQPDTEFADALGRINENLTDLPPDAAKSFSRIVNNRVLSRMKNGPLNGEAVQDIQSQLGRLSSTYGSSADGAQRALGDHLSEARDEIAALAARTNPDYAQAKMAADKGWANFVRVRDAASRAGTDSGVFTPAQLKAAVRSQDASVGKGATARGDALMYDLADAGTGLMSSRIPNPGTADRLALGGLGGLIAAPGHVGVPITAGLMAAATPYLLMGRRIAASASYSTDKAELEAAAAQLASLAARDPKVRPLYLDVMRRLAPSATIGISASTTSTQPTR